MALINTLLEIGDVLPVIIVSAIMAAIVVILAINIKIVPQATASVIECLGKYKATWHTGLHFKIPFVERIVKRVSLMEQIEDFAPQLVITKDNVVMQVDTVVFYQITDPKLYTYGAAEPIRAIQLLAATTIRNIIGELDLDQTLASRPYINAELRSVLDETTDHWGVKVNRVEIMNIVPPEEIQNAMEQQMRAERERRALVIAAEGQKASAILVAEGEAEAIVKVQSATADGIKMINESNPSEAVLTLKSLEAFAKAADGQATKIIIPSNIQGIAGLANALTESVVSPK
jgi:regulator of protease activity HflC (stomatin/prohibitin superfamily)